MGRPVFHRFTFPNGIGYLLIALLAILASPAAAQDIEEAPKRDVNFLFAWKFANNFLSTNLPACETRPILAIPRDHTPNEKGAGPYYLLAIPPGGTPRRYEVGEDPDNLRWTPDFPVDTQVILSLVDSNGGAGGVGGLLEENDGLYTISGSANTSCIQAESASPSFKASSVIQNSLEICDKWPIEVVGGIPPYSFTILQPTSPNITNVTNPVSDDAFVYINRATTGQLLAVAVSDATHQFALGTPSVMVTGSTDPRTCSGNSVSTTIAKLTEKRRQKVEDAQNAPKSKQVAIAIGVTFALLVPMSLAALYWYLRRRGMLPTVLTRRLGSDPVLASETGEGRGPSAQEWNPPTAPLSIVASRTQHEVTPFNAREPTENSPASTRRTHPSFTTFPVSQAARAKAEESLLARRQNSHSASSVSGSAGEPSQSPGRGPRQPSIIIQHEDGGAIRELPPPYADRTQQPPQDQNVLVGSTSTSALAPITSALAPIESPVEQPPASPFYSVLDDQTPATTPDSPQRGPGKM